MVQTHRLMKQCLSHGADGKRVMEMLFELCRNRRQVTQFEDAVAVIAQHGLPRIRSEAGGTLKTSFGICHRAEVITDPDSIFRNRQSTLPNFEFGLECREVRA